MSVNPFLLGRSLQLSVLLPRQLLQASCSWRLVVVYAEHGCQKGFNDHLVCEQARVWLFSATRCKRERHEISTGVAYLSMQTAARTPRSAKKQQPMMTVIAMSTFSTLVAIENSFVSGVSVHSPFTQTCARPPSYPRVHRILGSSPSCS